jgi:glycosyltransferase involved in cell wall biosynthesis/predicted metal-dependent phosphoesterase TrpH
MPVRVDSHVHSKFSDTLKLSVLSRANPRECYAEPEEIYRLARARGMDLVTISDHDTIAGVLEIAHHGDHVFLSEEISAVFPDNGCVMHVLAWDISEGQHAEIQRLRFNIYDLVAYLRSEDICHSLAHPLSTVNGRLRREHVEQCLLMFPVLELMNSSRDPYHWTAIEAITGATTPEHFERWANDYGLEPAFPEPRWSFTGGSDDHSGIAVARGYMEFDGPATVAALKDAVRDGVTRPVGHNMTSVSFSHNVYAVTMQYFVDANKTQDRPGIYDQLFRVVASGGAAVDELGPLDELMQKPVGRLLMSLQQEIADGTEFPSAEQLLDGGADEEMHRRVNAIVQRVMRRVFTDFVRDFVEAAEAVELDRLTRLVGDVLQTMLLNIPYYCGFRHVYLDRRRALTMHEALDLGFAHQDSGGVAIFADTSEGVNGVSIGLRRMIRELREQGKRVHLLGLAIDTESGSAAGVDDLNDLGADCVVGFGPLEAFEVPGYPAGDLDAAHTQRIGVPPILEMMQWCVENRIELIQVSTPGPVGLAGMLIARLLGTPLIGQYHTNVPEYAARLIDDPTLAAICRSLVGWFYAGLDRVIVPSRATRQTVIELGVPAHRVQLIERGVDSERFSPTQRVAGVWEQHGLNAGVKLLYVGRMSMEKDLELLLDAFRRVQADGLHIELGMVGDGPHRASLAQAAGDLAGMAWTGYVHGEELARLVASADIFVFPSSTDSFGGAVIEAQAAALPAIVVDRGGPAEIVDHNRTGLVVPSGDVAAFATALRDLAVDRKRRQTMGIAAREKVLPRTHAAAAERLWAFYSERIAEDRDGRAVQLVEGI